MKTNEERIRRLEIWNRVLLAVLLFSSLGVVGNVWLNSMSSKIRSLSVTWQPSGEIRLTSLSDGPFVVTHLVKYGNNEGEKAVAHLAQPLAIVDSAGATLSEGEVAKLAWVNIYNHPITAPKSGTEIKALYFRSEVTARK